MKKRRIKKILVVVAVLIFVNILIPQLRWGLLDCITPNQDRVQRSLKAHIERELRQNRLYKGLSIQRMSVGNAYGWQKEKGCFHTGFVIIGTRKLMWQKYYYYDLIHGWKPLTPDKPFYNEVIFCWTKGSDWGELYEKQLREREMQPNPYR